MKSFWLGFFQFFFYCFILFHQPYNSNSVIFSYQQTKTKFSNEKKRKNNGHRTWWISAEMIDVNCFQMISNGQSMHAQTVWFMVGGSRNLRKENTHNHRWVDAASNDLKFKLSHPMTACMIVYSGCHLLKLVLDTALIQHKQQAHYWMLMPFVVHSFYQQKNFQSVWMLECHNSYLDCLEHRSTT